MGGLAAWLTAARFGARTVLVVALETPSAYLDPNDLATAALYGDGAAALVLARDDASTSGLLGGILGNDAAPGEPFTVPGTLPPRVLAVEAGRFRFQPPDAAYRAALDERWRALGADLRDAFPEAAAATRRFLPYAVSAPQVAAVAAAFGAGADATWTTLREHGCLGCAGPLVALDALRREKGAAAGDTLAFAAVAGGVAWGGFFWRL